jgi:hypothetical protein
LGASPGRWLRRGCFSAAALCLLLAVAVPAHAQDGVPVGAPEVWRGAASAGVGSVDVNRDALLPVEGVFRFVALDGNSVYETDLQTARASLLYPGEGAIQGPNLACGTFGGSFPPELEPVLDACLSYDYPLTVRADASTADAATDGAATFGKPTDPVSADAVGASAHADVDGTRTSAQMTDLRVLGMPGVSLTSILPIEELQVDPTVLRIESATSRTEQRIDQGALVVTAQSKLAGVSALGGLLRIGSIVSTSTATDDGEGKRTAAADIEVSGVTLGGSPAQITEDGLVVGSPAGAGPIKHQVQQAANQLLATLGARISVLDNVEIADDGTGLARAQAPGVLIEVSTRADGTPPVPGPLGDIDLNGEYVGTIQLGASGAAAGATNFEDEVAPPATDVAFEVPTDAGFAPGDLGVPDSASVLPEAPTGPGESADAPAEQYLRRVVDTFGGRVGLLYLAFGLSVLGLCLVPRFTLPARLPGLGL